MAEIDNLKSTGSMKTTGGSKKLFIFLQIFIFFAGVAKG